MKNQWPLWIFVIGVVVIVLFIFNYQGKENTISLSEIFRDEGVGDMPDIEYEYIGLEPEKEDKRVAEVRGKKEVKQRQEAKPKLMPETEQVRKFKKPEIPQVTKPQPVPLESDFTNAKFTIQVASYKNKPMAEKMLSRVKISGYPAYLVHKDLKDQGMWFRIYVGKFSTKSQAKEFLVKFKSDFPGSFIITPDN